MDSLRMDEAELLSLRMDLELSDSSSEELFPITHLSCDQFDYQDPCLYSGLAKAICSKDLNFVKKFVTEGRGIRSIDNAGNTPLHIAAKNKGEGSLEILRYLLTIDDIDINAVNFYGSTPLLISLQQKSEDAVDLLLNYGADVNKTTLEEVSPLHYSIRYSKRVTQQLIFAGANIDHVDYNGDSTLHDAVRFAEVEIVCMLLYYGADSSKQNSSGLTPFMLSLASKKHDHANELFEYVTDFNLATTENMSTLFLAISSQYPKIEEMRSRGAVLTSGECSLHNVFNMKLLPRADEFARMWSRFDCSCWPKIWPNILLYIMHHEHIEKAEKIAILRVILLNDDMEKTMLLTKDSDEFELLYLYVLALYDMEMSYDEIHAFVAVLLSCGLKVYESDLDTVYELFGYCDIFKLLLKMDIRFTLEKKFNIFPALIYSIPKDNRNLASSMKKLYKEGSFNILTFECPVDYENIFDFINEPSFIKRLVEICNEHPKEETEYFLKYVKEMPTVPYLRDMARIKTREFLCTKFNIKTCSQFYTILDSLELPNLIKRHVALEIPLYMQNLTPENAEFRKQFSRFRLQRIFETILEQRMESFEQVVEDLRN